MTLLIDEFNLKRNINMIFNNYLFLIHEEIYNYSFYLFFPFCNVKGTVENWIYCTIKSSKN